MNSLAQWLDDLALLPDFNADTWQAFQHQVECLHLSEGTLQLGFEEIGPVSGWLQEPSCVTEFRDCMIPFANGSVQRPLAGEFFRNGPDGCLHAWQLTHHGRGQWQLHHHQLRTCSANEANCLGEHTHQRHATRPAKLAFWRLWQADSEGAPTCRIALLHAIEENNA